MKVKDKIFIVIIGSNEIGRELTLKLLEKGAYVIVAGLDAVALTKIAQLAKNRGYSLTTVIINITDKKQVENLLNKTLSEFDHIDGVINNAGIIQPFINVNDVEFDIIERILNIDLYGTLNIIKVFLPHLLNRAEAHLVNISSMDSFFPVAGQAIHGASSAAVRLLFEALTLELKESNINVTTVISGKIYTGIKVESNHDMGRGLEFKNHKINKSGYSLDVAEIIIKAIEKNKPYLYVGKYMQTLNLLYRIHPKLAASYFKRNKHTIHSISAN